MLGKKEILAVLPHLLLADLREIQVRLSALVTVPEADDDGAICYEEFRQYIIAHGGDASPYSVFRRSRRFVSSGIRDGVLAVNAFVDRHFAGVRRPVRQRAVRMVAKCCVLFYVKHHGWLTEFRGPYSAYGAVLQRVGEAVDDQLPGYAAAGLLKAVLISGVDRRGR
jgi:hypothetical protein